MAMPFYGIALAAAGILPILIGSDPRYLGLTYHHAKNCFTEVSATQKGDLIFPHDGHAFLYLGESRIFEKADTGESTPMQILNFGPFQSGALPTQGHVSAYKTIENGQLSITYRASQGNQTDFNKIAQNLLLEFATHSGFDGE